MAFKVVQRVHYDLAEHHILPFRPGSQQIRHDRAHLELHVTHVMALHPKRRRLLLLGQLGRWRPSVEIVPVGLSRPTVTSTSRRRVRVNASGKFRSRLARRRLCRHSSGRPDSDVWFRHAGRSGDHRLRRRRSGYTAQRRDLHRLRTFCVYPPRPRGSWARREPSKTAPPWVVPGLWRTGDLRDPNLCGLLRHCRPPASTLPARRAQDGPGIWP